MGAIMKIWCCIVILLVIPVKQAFSDNAGLVKAAAAGDIAAVHGYLAQGKSIESRDRNGKTALIAASQHGHTGLVKLLLDRGAAVNAKTSSGSTAFYYAAQNHHIDSLKLLHARGADVDTLNQLGFRPLSSAVVGGDEEVVRLLLGYSADPDAKLVGSPLLTHAIDIDSVGTIHALLDKGADVNATGDGAGVTPLIIAVARQQMATVKLLLSRGANIRVKDVNDKSVLHWLLCNTFSELENTKLLKLLLNSGADNNGQARSLVGFKDGSTPLICAVRRDFQKSVNMLLAQRPDVNLKNNNGHTALYYAVEEQNEAMVKALLAHGANPALEAEVERRASSRFGIGSMLLTALQPTLEVRSGKCPKYNAKDTNAVEPYQPVVTLDPLQSHDFPVARVEVLKSIPPVDHKFSLSPDGKWLVVREKNRKTSQGTSRRLVVYDIANQRSYFFSPEIRFRVAEDRWLSDSSRYVLGNRRQLIIDIANGKPQLRELVKPLPHSEPLYAGGDPCPWRNNKGQVVLSRPDWDDDELIWSADGKLVYSLQAGGDDEYYLIARRGKEVRKLVHHSSKWLRIQELTGWEKAIHPDKRAEFEEFKKEILEGPADKLIVSQLALSPNDRFLYYRIGTPGGPGFFGLPYRHIVLDLSSTPAQVWLIDKKPWGTPQWHPNGRDLYFIDQNATAQSDPDFPPMRQPSRWRLSVARFLP